jgi:hypothetical protein
MLDFLACLAGLESAAARAAVLARFDLSLFQASTAFWCLEDGELGVSVIGQFLLGWGSS